MMLRVLLLVGVLLGPTAIWAKGQGQSLGAEEDLQSRVASAGQQNLAKRIPAVSGRFFRKAGRFEISPRLGLSLNDPFFKYVPLGVGLNYHLFESIAVGVSGEYLVSFATPIQVTGGGTQEAPKYNRPTYAARVAFTWTPFYGKINLMAESVLNFDTYVSAAAGLVGPLRTSPTFEGSMALGQRYFVTQWMAIQMELRAQFYGMARRPKDSTSKEVQSLLTASMGISFFLPTDSEPESF